MVDKSKKLSCGILLYRKTPGLEVFLAKPGGPFGKHAMFGIPKGKLEDTDKDHKAAAIREFNEETGANIDFDLDKLILLGSVLQNKKKIVVCYSYEFDLGDNFKTNSNRINLEYPKNSGKFISIPEIEFGKYFKIDDDLKSKMVEAQYEFVKLLIEKV